MARTAIVTAKVEPDVKKDLEETAKAKGISLSEYVSDILIGALAMCKAVDTKTSKKHHD